MPEQDTHKKILIAPLNWGLGHATRCIPVIRELMRLGYNPVLAGDGKSFELLKKEFPELPHFELPSYDITYSKKGYLLLFKLLLRSPAFIQSIKKEKKIVEQLVEEEKIDGIISDNRFGVRSSKIPSVFVTHQIRVLSGLTTGISSLINRMFINRFDECWVPDQKGKDNLSGSLSDPKGLNLKVRFIGTLSRFSKQLFKKDIQWLAVLSGPEPQRSYLENRLKELMPKLHGSKLLIQGKIDKQQEETNYRGIRVINFMLSKDLEAHLNRSDIVISRSGYSSVMDLKALGSKTVFIPTPGQPEQTYLAKRMKNIGIAFYADQNEFTIKDLKKSENYMGFVNANNEKNCNSSELQAAILQVFSSD